MKLYKLLLTATFTLLAMGTFAQIDEARIYINPGHGGWGPNDRPLATINYEEKDTLGFFETNTNLLKAFGAYSKLRQAGAGYIKLSRNKNGIVAEGDKYKTDNDEIESENQIVTLSTICEDVEANNMDYFLSIHSNASTIGSLTNFPLLLYRGTDSEVGNGLVEAKNMAVDAWKYIANNKITYYSAHNAANSNNNRGDITFMGSQSTNHLGYTGYYGVLKHGCDGFLSEGCFYTYQPEAHRMLNPDYCRQEGVRYSRAIRAWFGDNSETKGDIMGTIKDSKGPLEHGRYNYPVRTLDAYAPINNSPVTLLDNKGNTVATYTTDKEHNGVFVFTDLEPGVYTLVYEIEGYWKETEEIEVKANETAFTNKTLTDTTRPEPGSGEGDSWPAYYVDPIQDGDIRAAGSYNFAQNGKLTLNDLTDLKIRRALLRDGKYYVLAIDALKNPKLLVINPATGELIKEMSTEGVVTTGYNGKELPYILSDIAFTTDGVLIGANSTVVGKEGNSYQTGNFYLYKWQGTEDVPLEDATPQIMITLPTNNVASIAAAGNNNSNLMANSIAVDGNLDDFFLYFDSHAGNGWTTTYGVRYVCWIVQKEEYVGSKYNNSGYSESVLGEDVRITLSPLGRDRFIIDGNKMSPREFQFNWDSADKIELGNFAGELPVESAAPTYFRYAKRSYMATPSCEKEDESYAYRAQLYDITDGLNKAVKIGTTETGVSGATAVHFMTAAGTVNNADIDLYLLTGTNLVSYSTKSAEQAPIPARVFAFGLTATWVETGYDIEFNLNENANNVELILVDTQTGKEETRIDLGAFNKGACKAFVANEELPDEVTCEWSLLASADNVYRFAKVAGESSSYQYFSPKGVSIDKSPESNYFGRIYITNMGDGESAGRTTSGGVYVLDPNGADITKQGNTAYTGNLTWTGTDFAYPRKVAVAADGRVFLTNSAKNSAGVYYMNPETFEISSLFEGATNSGGSLTIDGTYVCGQTGSVGIRGAGDETQLYVTDNVASGFSWRKFVNRYDIGRATTWTKAPSYSGYSSGSYIGNENNSIYPVSTGYWAGQYRGAGGSNVGNPCMFYYSDSHDKAVFNSHAESLVTESSQNGALSLNEGEKTIALSVDGGIAFFTYEMAEDGIPEVAKYFAKTGGDTNIFYDDFEFDYAGNLYAISTASKVVNTFAMPTDNNTCLTPARKEMTIRRGGPVRVEEEEGELTAANIYPNPATDYICIEHSSIIQTIDVYNVAGVAVIKLTDVNSRTKTVDLNELASGYYLVRVNNAKAINVMKR